MLDNLHQIEKKMFYFHCHPGIMQIFTDPEPK